MMGDEVVAKYNGTKNTIWMFSASKQPLILTDTY